MMSALFGRSISRRRLRRWLRGDLEPAGLFGLSALDRDELTWQAHRRLTAGAFGEAERIFDLLGWLWPRTAAVDARLGQGVCRQARGDLAGAERAFEEALADDPANPYALADRAEVRLLTGRPGAADADLEAARQAAETRGEPPELRNRIERLRRIVGESGS